MRHHILKKWAHISLLLLYLPALRCGTAESWHSANFFFFDTLCEVKLYTTPALFEQAQADIQYIFEDINALFSPDASDYSSPLVLSLFKKARELHRISKGAFDITVAPLSKLWGFLDGTHHVPSPELIKNTLPLVGLDKIIEKPDSLELPEGVSLDWGGIAKGYGIDLAAKKLEERGILRGFINAGGDLFCWGKNPSGDQWKIGIKHPRKEGFLGVLEIRDLAAATAGDYQRFFLEDGARYHHIFNPKTGYPASGKQSVTVVGPDTSICDALSTALFVSSAPEEILHAYPDYGAVIVDSAGEISVIGKEYPFSLSKN